jgi:3-dehydroquinate synthetase
MTHAAQVVTAARERGDGRFIVIGEAASAAATRALVRRPGALASAIVDPRGTTLAPVEKIVATARRGGATRGTVVVAVGSGALLDTARIAAALYEGGLPSILVPTTLGAAIERAVDTVARRGVIAVDALPAAVFVDYEAVGGAARDGLGTLVRDAMIEGDEFFAGIETLAPHPLARWPWPTLVDDALRVDRMHVAEERSVLELGQPFAEALTEVYALAPQAALALGLRAACLAARSVTRFAQSEYVRVLAVLALLDFALHDARIDANDVLDAIPSDVRFSLPHAIGDVEAEMRVSRATLRRAVSRLAHVPGTAEFR